VESKPLECLAPPAAPDSSSRTGLSTPNGDIHPATFPRPCTDQPAFWKPVALADSRPNTEGRCHSARPDKDGAFSGAIVSYSMRVPVTSTSKCGA
jgi:hypothetical protein